MNISPALPPYPPITAPASEQLAGDNQQRPAVKQPESVEGEQTSQSKADDKSGKAEERPSKPSNSEEAQAAQELQELKQRDQEVRVHEQAHAAAGGRYAGAPSYEYERGSDGKSYAVAGEVQIDVSVVEGDPQATIDKMAIVKRAALAPAEPSSADRSIASEATQKASAARAELAQQQLLHCVQLAEAETHPMKKWLFGLSTLVPPDRKSHEYFFFFPVLILKIILV